MQSTPQMFRQGDVLVTKVQAIPATATERAKDAGRVILAYGEVTGHCHQIDNPAVATLFDVPVHSSDRPMPMRGIQDSSDMANLLTYLKVDAVSQLVHDEHTAITLEPGLYQVTRQREYSPEEIRSVAD